MTEMKPIPVAVLAMMVAGGLTGLCADSAEGVSGGIAFNEANAGFSFNPHPEFPGAKGELLRDGGEWKLLYDFSGGGHGVGMEVKPAKPFAADFLTFEARHGRGHKMGVMVRDSAGQFFFRTASQVPFQWCRYVCRMDGGWPIHWGGANDGKPRPPFVAFAINADRITKGTPVPGEAGEVRIRNIAVSVRKPNASSVRYTITDFTSGDRFSAAPRRFCRDDEPWRRVENGDLAIDFSKRNAVSLRNEIPVWGHPREFLLTVEAPAEAAGLEFDLGFRSKGREVNLKMGRLRAAADGERTIRTVLSVPAPAEMVRSKRVMRLTIRRGNAPAKPFWIRICRLEADVRADESLPPILATPPTGAEPPQELEVSFLNLQSSVRENCAIRVRMSDWQGRDLGEGTVRLPRVAPGGRTSGWVRLPKVPEGLNFVSYDCSFVPGDARDGKIRGWTTSWTRPLVRGGDAVKRPDLPWGFGVYLHRTEDLFAYQSAYALGRGEESFALMERKAELAQAMGVKWERAEFQPHAICRDPGKFDFSFYDRLVDCAERHGISLYVVFSHYWPMRGKKRADQHDLTAYTPENYTNWVTTLGRSVERYRGRIAGWEIWNEPNIGFWDGPKEDYPKLVNLANPAVKAADPGARVIACSTAGVDLKFIDMCLDEGLRFDDISIHPYRSDPDERGFMADLAAVTNRSCGTKTWLTELGWPTGCDRDTYTERQQAAYFVRAYLAAAGSGCSAAINGYDFVDDGFNVLERENNFGIVRRDLTPKPAYRSLAKVFLTFMEGRPSISETKLADGVSAWVFRMGGRSAVWSDREALLKVVADGPARVSNAMDEPLGFGDALELRTGPLGICFLDRDVVSVEASSAFHEPPGGPVVTECEF